MQESAGMQKESAAGMQEESAGMQEESAGMQEETAKMQKETERQRRERAAARAGYASVRFAVPPRVEAAASVVGKKEKEGPLGTFFDRAEEDPMLGKKTWEEAESELQRRAARLCLKKAGLQAADIRFLFAGDLLGQIVATSFGLEDLGIPLFGLYGACSTMGEALSLAAMTVASGFADRVMALTSSHFASAERQFRFPLAYGNQRPLSATWTVTGCGCVILQDGAAGRRPGKETKGEVFLRGVTAGKIVDLGVRDSMNMGAAMAGAALDTILQNFRDFGVDETYYDRIITGDLGIVGRRILLELAAKCGVCLRSVHEDCGLMIFDCGRQDTHAGGSGCGCSAVTLCGAILPRLFGGEWRRVLFVPTGALLSQISFNEGQSIPGIAHGVMLESGI